MGEQDKPPDMAGDREGDGRWMTFAELAAVRGISKDSAVKLVRRHRWRRQTDNRGNVRALVPPDWAIAGEDRTADRPEDSAPDNPPDNSSTIKAFEAALAAVREAKDGEIAAWRGRAEAAEAERDQQRQRAEAAEQDVALQQGRAANAEAAQRQAEAEAQRLREADQARRSQGRWARLRAAWRGE